VALHPDVFETLVSWAEKFSATFFSRHLNHTCTKTDVFQQRTSVDAHCYFPKGQKCT
jgi:hypothetical protein